MDGPIANRKAKARPASASGAAAKPPAASRHAIVHHTKASAAVAARHLALAPKPASAKLPGHLPAAVGRKSHRPLSSRSQTSSGGGSGRGVVPTSRAAPPQRPRTSVTSSLGGGGGARRVVAFRASGTSSKAGEAERAALAAAQREAEHQLVELSVEIQHQQDLMRRKVGQGGGAVTLLLLRFHVHK